MKLRVAGICFDFPGRPVLDGISFDVPDGRLVGVLGPNGAGKSTLLRCMHQALSPRRGSVLVDGTDLATLPPRQIALRVGVVPQSCSPGFQVSVGEFVRMGRYSRESFLGSPGEGDLDSVRRALADVGMTEFAERPVHELSGGEFRRVLIAQALAQETPVLLLDEPVQQLDLRHQIEVMDLVRRLARRPNSAVVVVLHDLSLAARYCDALVLLSNGHVAAAGLPEDVVTESNLRNVYGVEVAVDRCPETGTVRVVPLRPVAHDVFAAGGQEDLMKWAMKKGVGISRSASVWLIRTRIDTSPEFFLLEGENDAIVAEAHRLGARTIHVKGGDFFTSEDGGKRIDTVQKLLIHFDLLGKDPALDLWGEIVRDAEGPVKKGQPSHPESFGVYCLVQGYKAALPDDDRRMDVLPLQFAALYEWCRKVIAGDIVPPRTSPHGEPRGAAPRRVS